MQKIEFVFGWPVSEQVQLIPPYWEWPEYADGEPADLRYAIKLAAVVREWGEANPRTQRPRDITLHPALKPINRTERIRAGMSES